MTGLKMLLINKNSDKKEMKSAIKNIEHTPREDQKVYKHPHQPKSTSGLPFLLLFLWFLSALGK